MRDILFRGKRLDNGEWVYGDLIHNDNGYYPMTLIGGLVMSRDKHTGELSFDGHCLSEVDPKTVGQHIWMREFVVNDPSLDALLFEGDIVEFWVTRRIAGESCKSQYDGDCKIRATIVLQRGEWRLDLNNKHNHNLFAAKGNEKYDRDMASSMSFHNFRDQHNKNLDEYRSRNKNYKWSDIIRIGNIHDNPELLEE